MAILAIEKPTFQLAMRIITNITNAYPASVTTSFAHNYVNGTIVRLYIPQGYGMEQANKAQGKIVVTSDTTFTIDLDTTSFEPFVVPVDFPEDSQYPQVVPVGEVSGTLDAATQNVLPYSAT